MADANVVLRVNAKPGDMSGFAAMKAQLGGMGKTITDMRNLFMGGAVGLGMSYLRQGVDSARAAMNEIADIQDRAELIGVSAPEMSQLESLGRLTGTSTETLTRALAQMTVKAEKAPEAFRELGVSLQNTDGSTRNMKQVFLETMDALAQDTDVKHRNAMAMKIMGRGYKDLMEMMREYRQVQGDVTMKTEQEVELANQGQRAERQLRERYVEPWKSEASRAYSRSAQALEALDRGEYREAGLRYLQAMFGGLTGETQETDTKKKTKEVVKGGAKQSVMVPLDSIAAAQREEALNFQMSGIQAGFAP